MIIGYLHFGINSNDLYSEENRGSKTAKNYLNDISSPPMVYAQIIDFPVGKDISEYNLNSHDKIFIDLNQFFNYFLLNDNGIIYKVAYSKENIIKYVIVGRDSFYLRKFETSEGINVGTTYQELNNKLPYIKLYDHRGFGYFGQLPSGWKIVFFIGRTGAEYYPKNEDKIICIYKGGIEWTY
jgi:hypothetical protein